MTPTDSATMTERRMVLQARGPYRVAAGILALPCLASAAVPFFLDFAFVWQVVWALTCAAVGAVFAAVALRGAVSIRVATETTSRHDAGA